MVSSCGLALVVALIAFIVCLLYSPFYALMVAGSPIYIWRYLNCYDNPHWLMMIEAVLPFFVLGGVFGFLLNAKSIITARFAVAALSCFLICSVLVWVTLDDYPRPSCSDAV